MAADRRLSQRVSAETGNYASYRGGPGKIRDLSQEGVFIEDQDPLSVGTSSEFNLHLGNESVPVRGVVRSSIPEVGLGVQFVQVSPQARENLERYVNTLAQFPGEAGKQPENGRRVWVEIDKLKQQLDRERKGVAGLARRWGAVVALLVAIVAVPRGFVDLKHLVFGRPDTLLVQSNNVRLFYEPGERMVGVGFSFTLINEGQKDDVIGEPRVNLARAALPLPQKWVLPISKLDCSTLGAPTPATFVLQENSHLPLECSLFAEFEETVQAAFEQSGWRKLSISFTGVNNKTHEVFFCFELEDEEISEIFRSEDGGDLEFGAANCNSPLVPGGLS